MRTLKNQYHSNTRMATAYAEGFSAAMNAAKFFHSVKDQMPSDDAITLLLFRYTLKGKKNAQVFTTAGFFTDGLWIETGGEALDTDKYTVTTWRPAVAKCELVDIAPTSRDGLDAIGKECGIVADDEDDEGDNDPDDLD